MTLAVRLTDGRKHEVYNDTVFLHLGSDNTSMFILQVQ